MRSLLLSATVAVAFFSFVEPGFMYHRQKEEKSITSAGIPPEIHAILQNSCFDCHTKGGKKMAMNHVNFSVWDNYSEDKKEKKAADMVKMLKKGAMPPKIYRQSHPDKIPTPEQVSKIIEWADSMKEK